MGRNILGDNIIMKFYKYLNEDDIQKGLAVDEPEVSKEYSTDIVKKKIKVIKKALSMAKKEKESKANDAIIADLNDKLDKWKNVDSETEPAGPSIPAEILAGLEDEENKEEE